MTVRTPDAPPASTFDAVAELEAIRQIAAARRFRGDGSSKLDRYSFELKQLQAAGARPAEIHLWLQRHGLKCALTTVTRWLAKHGQR